MHRLLRVRSHRTLFLAAAFTGEMRMRNDNELENMKTCTAVPPWKTLPGTGLGAGVLVPGFGGAGEQPQAAGFVLSTLPVR